MSDAPVQKAKQTFAFLKPQNRVGVAVVITIVAMIGIVIYGVHAYTSKASEVKVSTQKVNAQTVKAEADAEVSEAYRNAKSKQNADKYAIAEKTNGGVAVPFVFPADEQPTKEDKISQCQCTVSDEQLLDALKRLGYDNTGAGIGFKRVASSDLYLDAKNNLVSSDGAPILFRGGKVSMDQSGAILAANGTPAMTTKGENVYIGKNGEILNSATEKALLAGDILSASGEIYMGDGKIATGAGSRKRMGGSDIFLSSDGQLMTIDARPITASGMFVYADQEGLIKNRARSAIEWELQRVYIDKSGALVDPSGKIFKTPGILFSYKGIMIDNNGKLTKELENIHRLGSSDIYETDAGYLVDENSNKLLHYGQAVKVNKDRIMNLDSGQHVTTITGFGVKLELDGSISTSGNGIAQTGILRSINGVAINKNGHYLSRPGYLERMGNSDIYLSPDKLLADAKGRPLYNGSSDVVIGTTPLNKTGDTPLNKIKGQQVTDKNNAVVFITKTGVQRWDNGTKIQQTGLLRDFDGVAYNADGFSIVNTNGLVQVFKEGYPVKYKGQDVFKQQGGKLVTKDGEPVISDDGRAIYMDDAGNTVDEFGKTAISTQLTANGKPIGNGKLTAEGSSDLRQIGSSDLYVTKDGLLVDAKGRLISANGDAVSVRVDTGAVVNDKNEPVTDKYGMAISITKDGVIKTGTNNQVTNDDPLNTWDHVLVSQNGKDVSTTLTRIADSDIYSTPNGSLVDSMGRFILFEGKRVYIDQERKLLAFQQTAVADGQGIQIFLSQSGAMSDKSLQPNKVTVLTNHDGVFYDWDGRLITDGGRIEKINGTDLYKTVDLRLVTKSGRAVIRKEEPLFITKDNMIATKREKAILIKRNAAYIANDGRLIDRNGQAILDDKQLAVYLSSTGEIINEDGGLATLSEADISNTKQAVFKDLVDPSKNNQPHPSSPPPAEKKQESPNKNNNNGSSMDDKAAERLRERYGIIKNTMRDQFKEASAAAIRDTEYEMVAVKGVANSGLDEEENNLTGDKCRGANCTKNARQPAKILKQAGSMLFAVTEHKVNSDYSSQVMVKLVGLPQNDPLYGAKMFGTFQLKYDHLVLEFNKIALPNGGVASVKGVAVDANTADMGLQGEVDNHYLYRFGGLFVASLMQGAADAASKTGDRTTSNSMTQSTETITGLSGPELAVASMGKTGEAFTKVFADNVTRPTTVTLGAGQEMGIILFEDVVEQNKNAVKQDQPTSTDRMPPELQSLLRKYQQPDIDRQ